MIAKHYLSKKHTPALVLMDKIFHTKGVKELVEEFRSKKDINPSMLEADSNVDYRWRDWFECIEEEMIDDVHKLLEKIDLPHVFFETMYRFIMTDKFESAEYEEDPQGLILHVDEAKKTVMLEIGPNTRSRDYKNAWKHIKKKLPFSIIDSRDHKISLEIKMHIYRAYKSGKTVVEISRSVVAYIKKWEEFIGVVDKDPYTDPQYIRSIISKENDKHGIPKSERSALEQGMTQIQE
jgi:hypothetical protein